ncbi:chromatin assembly factor 1 subunit B [Eurytemora carolleeae]|uniref:chromatin assembly factor 1 subunit B n=1 Tax=Eurytemora carolleeae TaxID=1294199 RepID=UPI000C75CB4A|nr:chromatin assembly factor 1 subunit B [Eurytemora carolleeae]|eukprot:XP_023329591.1 chromatin assembly factor 1 subunit B-like [Eurytemora affinis]
MSQKTLLRSFGITEDDEQKMISDAVFFLLVADQKKTVIKRSELIKHCDLGKKEKRLQDHVIDKAMLHLQMTFGIEVDSEVLELYDGDVKKFINDVLVGKQHYLKRDKVPSPDEVEVYEYSWGERAEKEVKQSDVFKLICHVYQCEPKMFTEQLERIKLTRKDGDPLRLATAGSDTHVVIFSVTEGEDGKYQKAVNIVRWSPDGDILASGDDESVIILWQLKQGSSDAPTLFDEDSQENKENWVVYKMLRFHLDDVYDLSWSPCSQFLLSGSVDNTAIISNVHKQAKVGHLSDSQGFVQGVSWNPKHNIMATLSSDRRCRFYNSTSRKRIGETYKAFLNLDLEKKKKKKKTETSEEGPLDVEKIEEKEEKIENTEKNVRLFHDDTFKGFFRRLSWSNDGELLVVPSGVMETDTEAKITHCTYVFTRIDLNRPAICLPSRDKYTIAVRFSPVFYKLRPVKRKGLKSTVGLEPWEIYSTVFSLPYRQVYAVATQNAVMLYDTQQIVPIGRVSNIHYTGLTDLAWSPDGKILMVSSSDGFCSIISFTETELGEMYIPEPSTEPAVLSAEESPIGTPERKKVEEEEEEVRSPSQVHIKSTKEGGKSNPKRLKFITLSSPKADRRLIRPETVEDVARYSLDDDEDGVELMETESGDLNLVLEDTQTQQSVPVAPVVEKKRVPLVSIPANSTSTPTEGSNECSGKGRRVELITLSSPKPKSKH